MGRQVLVRHLVDDFSGKMTQSGVYDGSGDLVVQLGNPGAPTGLWVEVERIIVDISSGSSFGLYAFDPTTSIFLREYAGAAFFATDPIQVFDEQSPVRFNPQEGIVAAFTGGTPGDVVTIYCQAWTTYYEMIELPDRIGEGTIVTRGQHRGPGGASPDPGGWN